MKGAQMEHGQHGHVADQQVRVVLLRQHVPHPSWWGITAKKFRSQSITPLLRPVVPEVNIRTIRASGSMRFQARRLVSLRRHPWGAGIAVGSLQLLVAAVVTPSVRMAEGCHQLQLPVQLVPALALVQQTSHRPAHAKGVHGILVAVLGDRQIFLPLISGMVTGSNSPPCGYPAHNPYRGWWSRHRLRCRRSGRPHYP